MWKANAVDQIIIDSQKIHTAQAYDFMERLIAARDPVTRLLPLHVKTDGEKLVAVDHSASGIDMGRATAGLVMLSQLARAEGELARADKYLKVAEENYKRGKELLAEGDYFVHQRDFDDQGNLTSNAIGEHDNMSRVNPRAYAFRAAAELYCATDHENYQRDLERYFEAWVRDFHDPNPVNGGFFIHANVMDPADHREAVSFKDPGGVDSRYDGRLGLKGNDGTIYTLSAVLLQANEILGTEQTQNLVKEQLDIILGKMYRQNGMLWENYTNDWKPISADWQNLPIDAPQGQSARTSHVAIGGHTAMASQQIIEGARQLLKQGKINEAEYASYIHHALDLFQEFATQSGAIAWNIGVVHNAIRVEEPRMDHRWYQPWGNANWQQAELIQTLLRFRQESLLEDIKGPNGKTGEELLRLAEHYYVTTYPVPANYEFKDFANPDVYHRPQLALYHHEVTSQLGPKKSR